MPPRDPRYRPYRMALWITYFAVIAISSAVVVTSIVRDLRGPPEPAPGDLPTRASLRVCVSDLEKLQREQNERLWRFGAEVGEGDAVARWNAWSVEWETRMRDLAARCALDRTDVASADRPAIEQIGRARNMVLELHASYARLVNRFASDQAELAGAARRAIDEAREAVARRR